MSDRRRKLVDAITLICESAHQAEHDFCGEQRNWHLPRLQKAWALLLVLFPDEAIDAMKAAKSPFGDYLLEDITR